MRIRRLGSPEGGKRKIIKERTVEAFEFDKQLTVVGSKLQPGNTAPEFELDYFYSENEEMKVVRLSDSAGNVRLLSIVNLRFELLAWVLAEAAKPDA